MRLIYVLNQEEIKGKKEEIPSVGKPKKNEEKPAKLGKGSKAVKPSEEAREEEIEVEPSKVEDSEVAEAMEPEPSTFELKGTKNTPQNHEIEK